MGRKKLSVYVDEQLERALRARATALGLPVSAVVADNLRQAVVQEGVGATMAEVQGALERAINRAVAKMADRVAYLSAYAAIEAGATRRLVAQWVAHELGAEVAQTWAKTARVATVRRMRQDPTELLRELEAAREAPDGEGRAR